MTRRMSSHRTTRLALLRGRGTGTLQNAQPRQAAWRGRTSWPQAPAHPPLHCCDGTSTLRKGQPRFERLSRWRRTLNKECRTLLTTSQTSLMPTRCPARLREPMTHGARAPARSSVSVETSQPPGSNAHSSRRWMATELTVASARSLAPRLPPFPHPPPPPPHPCVQTRLDAAESHLRRSLRHYRRHHHHRPHYHHHTRARRCTQAAI